MGHGETTATGAGTGTGTTDGTTVPAHRYLDLARQLRAVGVVGRGMARNLPADCPPASAGLLNLLHRHGEMRASRLTELLAIDTSVTSRHVAHLVERGWIERQPDPDDGRSRLLRLTPAGRDKLEELSDRATAFLQQQLHDWSEQDLVTLVALLERLRAGFGDCEHPAAPPRLP